MKEKVILEFSKESINLSSVYEGDTPRPDKFLRFELTGKYENMKKGSRFPYKFFIEDSNTDSEKISEDMDAERMFRDIGDITELKNGYFILYGKNNQPYNKIDKLKFTNLIRTSEFDNEFFVYKNHMDDLEEDLNSVLDDKENDYCVLLILGDVDVVNTSKIVYDLKDPSRKRIVEMNNTIKYPLKFLQKYKISLSLEHIHKASDKNIYREGGIHRLSKPRDYIFGLLCNFDVKEKRLIDDVYFIQYDDEDRVPLTTKIPLYGAMKGVDYNNYVKSDKEVLYEGLDPNNKTFYGIGIDNQFNIVYGLSEEGDERFKEFIYHDEHHNIDFNKKRLIELYVIGEDLYKINSNLDLNDV